MLIQNVTVYRDILSDIKREYEECINALKNGEREAKFLRVKVKTLGSIPTTVHGYMKRENELNERYIPTLLKIYFVFHKTFSGVWLFHLNSTKYFKVSCERIGTEFSQMLLK